jgi:hypothetical protein
MISAASGANSSKIDDEIREKSLKESEGSARARNFIARSVMTEIAMQPPPKMNRLGVGCLPKRKERAVTA